MNYAFAAETNILDLNNVTMKIIIIKLLYNQQSYYLIPKLTMLTLRVHCEPINITFGIRCILCVVSLMSTHVCKHLYQHS